MANQEGLLMDTCFVNGKVYIDNMFIDTEVLVHHAKISKIEPDILIRPDTNTIDLQGSYLIPGFIDIHTHGATGVDVNAAKAEDFEKASCFFAKNGTTSWLCSILTDTKENTLRTIREAVRWKSIEHHGAELLGIHLEGPFLSREYKGAMPENLLMNGDLDLIREYQKAADGMIKYMTVAPEVDGVLEIIPELVKMGISVAIGHSGAGYETTQRAISLGASSGTHVGNAMRSFDRHEPGIFGAILENDSVFVETICDGKHLHPGAVRLYNKIKTRNKMVAITDSIMATGLPNGNYKLGENDITVINGDAKLKGKDTRAGSTLTMDAALQNVMSMTGERLENVVPWFTENPAKVIKMDNCISKIRVGADADFNIVRNNRVLGSFCRGKKIRWDF